LGYDPPAPVGRIFVTLLLHGAFSDVVFLIRRLIAGGLTRSWWMPLAP
jgi:hypothetical protein